MQLLLNYSVKKCNAKLALYLFKANELDGFHSGNEVHDDNGWQVYNKSQVDIIMVEGDHITIL